MSYEMEQVRLTLEHIRLVGRYLQSCASTLVLRAVEHDSSKFSENEWPGFLRTTENLKGCTYGSPEYRAFLEQLQPTLEHHYAENRHHPEHHDGSIAAMTLLDLTATGVGNLIGL